MPRDLKNAFGRAPESFNQRYEDTLLTKLEEQDMKLSHKSISGIWIAAIILILLMGTALAITGGLGVLDFKPQTEEAQMAQEKVVDLRNVPSVESDLVTYQVQDAVCDGNRLLFTVHIQAKDPDKHFLMAGSDPDAVGIGYDKPFKQLAKEQGKTLVNVEMPQTRINGEWPSMTGGDTRSEPGQISWLLEPQGVPLADGPVEVELILRDCIVHGVTYEEQPDSTDIIMDTENESEHTLAFTVEPDPIGTERYRFTGPFEEPYITIDWIEISRSPLGTYSIVQYTVPEDVPEEGLESARVLGFWLQTGPKDGRFMGGSGSTVPTDEDSGRAWDEFLGRTFIQTLSWDPVDQLPETFYIRPHYPAADRFGEAIELNLSQAD